MRDSSLRRGSNASNEHVKDAKCLQKLVAEYRPRMPALQLLTCLPITK
jgi:hypothetical protein